MSILITGGLGYIGGRLCSHLKNLYPDIGITVTTRKQEGQFPMWAAGFDVRTVDLQNEREIEQVLKGIDLAIHLASTNEIDSARNPAQAIDVNAKGTYNLLSAANALGVRRFIYVSTYHIYDIHQAISIDENSNVRPVHPYSITHYAAECFVEHFKLSNKLKTLILRISNSYGYPMDISVDRWILAFNDFCRQAILNEKIVLKTSGRQHRDFISMTDVCRAVEHFAFKYDDWGDGLYNLGGNCSMSIYDAAQKVASVYNRLYEPKAVKVEAGCPASETNDDKLISYSTAKLAGTGFVHNNNMEYEIEETLRRARDFINV